MRNKATKQYAATNAADKADTATYTLNKDFKEQPAAATYTLSEGDNAVDAKASSGDSRKKLLIAAVAAVAVVVAVVIIRRKR